MKTRGLYLLGTEKEMYRRTRVSGVLNEELKKRFLLHAQRMLIHHRKLLFNTSPLQRTHFKEHTVLLFVFAPFKMSLSTQRRIFVSLFLICGFAH